MRLHDVARRFDTMVCSDAYSGATLFKGQLGLYDDTKRDSEASERRVLSTGPGVTLPQRRVIAGAGSRWIVGHGNPDFHRSGIIRVGYVVHEATDLASVRTLAQTLADSPGFSAWVGEAWVKNSAFTEQSSKLTGQHHIFFATGEPVQSEQIVLLGTGAYLVRLVRPVPGGMQVAETEHLHEPSVQTVTVTTGAYDPITATRAAGSQALRVLRMRWQALFAYGAKVSPTYGPEDQQWAFPVSSGVVSGQVATAPDGTWKVASVEPAYGVRLCRMVHHD